MSTNDFDPEISNSSLNSVQYYTDTDGSLKFISPYLSSANFNGTIPFIEKNITASSVLPGMLLEISNDQFFQIMSLEYDDVDLEGSSGSTIVVYYLNDNNDLNSKIYNLLDTVSVRHEDWEEKVLGTQGWSITSGGNAIFTNVGVRGDLEATTLDVGGADGITYDGNTVTIGASVIINAPLTIGASGNFIVSGSAAQDIISNNTTITGGNIATGKIKSQGYSGPGTASAFSASGMLINLDDGSITAPNFKIDNTGNAHFKGVVESASGNLAGFILSASQISIAGFTMSTASGIHLGNNQQFKVDIQGNLVATSASISGDIRAKSGTFSGSVTAAQIYGASVTSGYFSSQTIVGASVTGGIITGQQIVGGTIIGASGTFTGDLTATNLTASAGSIGGFIITQNSLNANNFAVSTTDGIALGSASQFSVNTSGVLKASTASISGDITANSGRFLGSVGVDGNGLIYAGNNPSTGQRVILTSSGLYGYDSGNINIFSLPITGSPTIAGFTLINNGITGSGQMANIIIGTRDANAYNITLRGDKTGGQAAAIYTTVNGVATTSNANNGFYLDDNGKMRLAGSNGTLTFDGNNLFVTGYINATSGSFSGALSAATGTFSGTLSANSITSGTIDASVIGVTNLNATNITTGTLSGRLLQTSGYSGAIDGSAFSSLGTMAINLSNGTITAPGFRINSSGAFFQGDITGSNGTFSGTVSANNVTAGTLTGSTFRSSAGITATSGNGIYLDSSGNVRFATTSASLQFNSGGLTVGGGTISGAVINGGSINGGSITGGTISGQSGNIGGFTLGPNSFTAGTNPNVVGILTGGTNAFFAGASDTAGTGAKFLVTNAGALTATNANITGAINATSGTFAGSLSSPIGNIGGFTIGANSLTAGSSPNIVGISTTSNSFFAGATSTTGTGAKFNVTSGGVLTATGATISGAITATSGYFGNSTYGMSINDNTGTGEVTVSLGTLRLGSKISSSILHGSLDVYNTSGSRIGQVASSQSSKDWSGLGSGVIVGTNSDYMFLPSSGNSIKPRIYGSGIEFWQTGAVSYALALSGTNFNIARDLNVQSGYVYKTNGNTFINSSRALTVDGITNQSNGITNNGGQIYSLPSANNAIAATANLNIDSVTGLIKRISSTQRVKHSIVALSETSFGESVLKNKIVDGLPNINYLNVLNITPVEFKTIEDGIETNRTLLGFIAEDIADKVPEIATYDENGNPEYYDINGIVSGLLAIVQDQQKEINQLQDRLKIIEERLEL